MRSTKDSAAACDDRSNRARTAARPSDDIGAPPGLRAGRTCYHRWYYAEKQTAHKWQIRL
eukprot:13977-Heterococcus_DN1.PRE.1